MVLYSSKKTLERLGISAKNYKPPKTSTEVVKIDCELIHETEAAYLVEVEKPGSKKAVQIWVPKSQVEYKHKGINDWLEMPEWMAMEKGLI